MRGSSWLAWSTCLSTEVVALLNEPRNTRHMPLPYSRSPDRAVARLGFQPDGDVDYGGVAFRPSRLTRQAWTVARGPA